MYDSLPFSQEKSKGDSTLVNLDQKHGMDNYRLSVTLTRSSTGGTKFHQLQTSRCGRRSTLECAGAGAGAVLVLRKNNCHRKLRVVVWQQEHPDGAAATQDTVHSTFALERLMRHAGPGIKGGASTVVREKLSLHT